MKKKVLCVVGFIIIIIAICLILLNMNYTTYKLSPSVCNVILGVTPSNFVDNQGQDTLLKNGYTYAKIDKDGNLILILSKSEENAWKSRIFTLAILDTIWGEKSNLGVEFIGPQDDFEKTLFDAVVSCGLELSQDYTMVVAESKDNTLYYPWFINMGVTMQVFEGVPSEEIRVEYIEYNQNGKIVNHVVWPDDADENGLVYSSQ